LNLEPEKRKR